MTIDSENSVVALCVAGMEREGTPDEARRLFEQAWAARRDDYDACIAAHYLARHQPTPEETLRWNAAAARHAEAVGDGRADGLLASLYLNLADSLLAMGNPTEAAAVARRAEAHLVAVPDGGYRDRVAFGIRRLEGRLGL